MQAVVNNEFLTLTVDTFGAEMVSLKNASGDEIIWQADKSVWNRHAPILFPWTGKLTGGKFIYNGKTYEGGQHGFARDLEHKLISAQDGKIVMELSADEKTLEIFPFDFTLTNIYQLEGKTLNHSMIVKNNGSNAMNFGIGYHPAFNIPFDENHSTEDYEFRFEKPESPIVIDTCPNGLVSGKNYYVWKNTDKIQLTDNLFENDSFCMTGLKSSTLGIFEKDTGKNITCSIEGFPYTLLWSANTDKVKFVCIEPWQSLPGAEADTSDWDQRAAAATLANGESYEVTLSMCIER